MCFSRSVIARALPDAFVFAVGVMALMRRDRHWLVRVLFAISMQTLPLQCFMHSRYSKFNMAMAVAPDLCVHAILCKGLAAHALL